jgi:hypothetical protein
MINKAVQQFIKNFSDMWKLRHAVFAWRHGNIFWYDKQIFDCYLTDEQELEILDHDESNMPLAIERGQSRKRIKQRYKVRSRRKARATARQKKMVSNFLLRKRVIMDECNVRQLFLFWRVRMQQVNEELADARFRAAKAWLAWRSMHALKEARHFFNINRHNYLTTSARSGRLIGGADENLSSSIQSDMEEDNGSEHSAHDADPDFEFKKNDHDSEGSDEDNPPPPQIECQLCHLLQQSIRSSRIIYQRLSKC